jgi:hypothetical protein
MMSFTFAGSEILELLQQLLFLFLQAFRDDGFGEVSFTFIDFEV